MAEEERQKGDSGEKRGYFRIDDVIPVIANPVHLDKEKAEEFRRNIVSSKAFSLMDVQGRAEDAEEESMTEIPDNIKLYTMMTEIKTKLDFIINQLMLDKEGLIKSEKKLVNISASGIRFTLDHPVKINEIMEIKLLLPTYPPVAIFAYGEVKRVKDLGEHAYEVSLEYLNMSEPVRNEIIQYTMAHQRETIRKTREAETK